MQHRSTQPLYRLIWVHIIGAWQLAQQSAAHVRRRLTCEMTSGTSPSRVDRARYASIPRPLPVLPRGLPRLLLVLLSCRASGSLPEPALVSCACGDCGALEACFSALRAQGRSAALAMLISSASSSCTACKVSCAYKITSNSC